MNVSSGEIAKKRYLKMRDIRVTSVLFMKPSMLQTFNKTNDKPKEHIKESTDHNMLTVRSNLHDDFKIDQKKQLNEEELLKQSKEIEKKERIEKIQLDFKDESDEIIRIDNHKFGPKFLSLKIKVKFTR